MRGCLGRLPCRTQQTPGREPTGARRRQPGRALERMGSYQPALLTVPAGTASVSVGADSSGLPREVSVAPREAECGPWAMQGHEAAQEGCA